MEILFPISVYSLVSIIYIFYTLFFNSQTVCNFIYKNVPKILLTLFQVYGTVSIILWINATLSFFDAVGPRYYNYIEGGNIVFWWNILPAKSGDSFFLLIMLNIVGAKGFLLLNSLAGLLKKGPVHVYRRGIFTIYKNK
jgi:hypothetical protein